jgi:hypothetical protein
VLPPQRPHAAAADSVDVDVRVPADASHAAVHVPDGAGRVALLYAAVPPGAGGLRPRRPPAAPSFPSSLRRTGRGRLRCPEAGTRSRTDGPA